MSSRPETNRPSTAPPPASPTHRPTALPRSSGGKEVVMIDRVVGMVNAAPTPMTARHAMTTAGSLASAARAAAPIPKTARPVEQRPLAAVAVADRAREQQQPGEHHGVGVDDPLHLGLRGAGLDREARQRDVEPAHRRDHHHQRDRDRGQHQPAPSCVGDHRRARGARHQEPPLFHVCRII